MVECIKECAVKMEPDQKKEMIEQQVVSKIHWGASDHEVRDWLSSKHRIYDDEADQLIDHAFKIRAKEIRGRAVIRLIFSIVGILIVLGWFLFPLFTGYIFVGMKAVFVTIAAGFLGIISATFFFRSLSLIFTGKTFGAVDK